MTTNTATEALLRKGSVLQVVVGLGHSGLTVTQYFTKQGYQVAVKENKVNLDKVEVFFETPNYYDYNWTINDVDKKFGEGTKEKMKQTLLGIKSGDSEILSLLSTDSFIPTKNDNYKDIEKVARFLKIIK